MASEILPSKTIIGVCGAGAMGAGIAQVAACAGHQVVVYDLHAEAIERGRAQVEKGIEFLVSRGKIDAENGSVILANCKWTNDLGDLREAGLVIEAIIERADIKQKLFAELESVLSTDAAIATNTSSLSVTTLASTLSHPERFFGLHFFNPAPVMRLVEVIKGVRTNVGMAERALSLMSAWGKKSVMVRDVPGFIVNRVARPFYSEGWLALDEGVSDAPTIDHIFRVIGGFRMGPLELGDLIGHDINFASADSVFNAYYGRVRFVPALSQKQLVDAGLLGRKTSQGVYTYGENQPSRAPTTVGDDAEKLRDVRIHPRSSFIDKLKQAGIRCKIDPDLGEQSLIADGVLISPTDGRSAKRRAQTYGADVILLDHGLGLSDPNSLVFSLSNQSAMPMAVAFAQALSAEPILVQDRPGLVAYRTWCQLANCAADALRDRVASADDIDTAMQAGVNYPMGPLAWARQQGVARVADALYYISDETGDGMYRPSEGLSRLTMEPQT